MAKKKIIQENNESGINVTINGEDASGLWRVNTAALLQEIGNNAQTAILSKPLQIFGTILFEVGERAAQLNDPILNALMVRLAIYECGDAYNKDYSFEVADSIIKKGTEAKLALKKKEGE